MVVSEGIMKTKDDWRRLEGRESSRKKEMEEGRRFTVVRSSSGRGGDSDSFILQ